MPLPIDVAGDWKRLHADLLRDVQYRAYDPAADAHGEPEECVGVRGPKRRTAEAGVIVTRATWTVTGVETPLMRSLIVDGEESWLIDAVKPDPADSVFELECHLT